MTLKNLIIILIIPVLFLLFSLKTLPDYGINWDNPMHYNRGHAYLHYFLTGKTNYLNLPKHSTLDESVDFKSIQGDYMSLFKNAKRSEKTGQDYRRSYYQSDVFNFEYFKEKDSGHPPINGIFAALTNYIFYQKLGLLGDLYSHLFFNVIVSFLLVAGVSILTLYLFGFFPAIIAGAVLSLYPLFLGESHFNIKDPILTSFYGLTIILFYLGVTKNNFILLLASAVSAGLSLGTKFNTLFMPFILLPWLIFYWITVKKFKTTKKELISLVIILPVPLIILFVTWPYLWFNGLSGLFNIFGYYADEGTGTTAVLSKFTFLGFNLFPITWILITTPVPILILAAFGIYWLTHELFKNKNHTALLLLLWLLVPIIRVTLPNTTIYGGVRHIMEFVPALAIVSAAGAYFLLKKFHKIKKTIVILLVLMTTLVAIEMVSIHPNQNVYFNQLIGGLSGAKQANIPFWGNSFGNAYQQGIDWLNKNAPKNSKLGLPLSGTINLPRERLRPDINLSNDSFSAFSKKGEYQIEMTHNSLPKNNFPYDYLETFLNPVYEVKVDNVAILKVWKNDLFHTKPGYDKEKNYSIKNVSIKDNQLNIELESKIYLTRLHMNYEKQNCRDLKNGYISISTDGVSMSIESDPISYPQMSARQIDAVDKDFFFLFSAKPAKFITVKLNDANSCLFNNPKVEAMGLEKIPD